MEPIAEILYTEEEIRKRVQELAAQISKDYQDKNLLLVGILKGSFIFLADLCRQIAFPCKIDFVAVSSYGMRAESSGVVRIIMDTRESLEQKDVLIVDDIYDRGLTLNYLKENFLTRRPASVKICALLKKELSQEVKVKIDYLGFKVPNKFIVGYGLDFAEEFRNLKYIASLKDEYIKEKMK